MELDGQDPCRGTKAQGSSDPLQLFPFYPITSILCLRSHKDLVSKVLSQGIRQRFHSFFVRKFYHQFPSLANHQTTVSFDPLDHIIRIYGPPAASPLEEFFPF
jgi:hypothetical protein